MFPNTFIEPDPSLAALSDPNQGLNIEIYSGAKAMLKFNPEFKNRNRIFDQLAEDLAKFQGRYEDQCSDQYYFDLVTTLRDLNGEFDRVVEVGVYMGGSSAIFGGCAERFDYDLDLVDIDARYLRFAHERIRRTFPTAAGRVRLFHGDLPHYVATVLSAEDARCLIHHDGAHDFNQVVKDLSSLYFVRDKVHAIIAQDTHLRGTAQYMNFVDMALYAVFGTDLKYMPIGVSFDPSDGRTSPNEYQGNYFLPDTPEGIVIPLAANPFLYPHPSLTLESFL